MQPVRMPSRQRQQERLAPRFQALVEAFEARRLELQSSPTGTLPEQVLVLETVGSISSFLGAVKRIEGLEWLGEWDEEDIAPDEDFYKDEEHRDSLLSGRLYLVMSNQEAFTNLLSLWKIFQEDGTFEYGTTRWRDLFSHLRTVRAWGAEDRLRDTGLLEDWAARMAQGDEVVRTEIEMWYRPAETHRQRTQAVVEQLVGDEGGRVLSSTILNDIAYHAVLAELPIGSVERFQTHQVVRLVNCDQVMFFRPVGQISVPHPEDQPLISLDSESSTDIAFTDTEPVVAVLDGLPLQNHLRLANRLVVDDPDGWNEAYTANRRIHGTAMTSLVIWGDLDDKEPPLSRPVYARPILFPRQHGSEEIIPEDILPVDLIHRAVRRLFEGEGDLPPVAPSVRIINYSVGDPSRPFDSIVSPLGRLLDWLSWKYQVLFVVSAGNVTDDIVLKRAGSTLRDLDPGILERDVIISIAGDLRNRRIYAPAESINALTVGAAHSGGTVSMSSAYVKDLLHSSGLPSPISRLGPGFRRAVKPEVLLAGGRQLFQDKFVGAGEQLVFRAAPGPKPPGLAAAPGAALGELGAIQYSRGTSNATAMTSRRAAQLYETIHTLSSPGTAQAYGESDAALQENVVPLIKALLVHGARWDKAGQTALASALQAPLKSRTTKEYAQRFLGYGVVDVNRVFACLDERVTIIGGDSIKDKEAHVYSLPLPPRFDKQSYLAAFDHYAGLDISDQPGTSRIPPRVALV